MSVSRGMVKGVQRGGWRRGMEGVVENGRWERRLEEMVGNYHGIGSSW